MKIETIPSFLQALDNEIQPEKIDEQLPLMLEIINDLLTKIKLSNDLQVANYYFDILQKIHDTLDVLIFHKNIFISIVELQRFVSDCERLDDSWQRNYLYQKIKSEQYSLTPVR